MYGEYINVDGDVPLKSNNVEIEKPKNIEKKPIETQPKVEIEKKEEKQDKSKKSENESKIEKEEIKKKELLKVKIKKDLKARYMPLLYSSYKVTYKKDETLEVLDEKGKWTKVKNKNIEAWILTINLL